MTRLQSIRKEVSMQLYSVHPLALSVGYMHRECRKNSLDYTMAELDSAAVFLVGQEHAEALNDPATGERKFTMTSKGMIAHESTI